jgi:hypothetical protein
LQAIEDNKEKITDVDQLTNGHDAISLFTISLQKVLATNNKNDVSTDQFHKIFRLTYNYNHFKESILYNSLRNWEKTHQKILI